MNTTVMADPADRDPSQVSGSWIDRNGIFSGPVKDYQAYDMVYHLKRIADLLEALIVPPTLIKSDDVDLESLGPDALDEMRRQYDALYGGDEQPRESVQTPKKPTASNGMTVVYAHPDPHWTLTLRRDPDAEGGYSAHIEPDQWARKDLG